MANKNSSLVDTDVLKEIVIKLRKRVLAGPDETTRDDPTDRAVVLSVQRCTEHTPLFAHTVHRCIHRWKQRLPRSGADCEEWKR